MVERKITILHANDIHGRLNFKIDKQMEIKGGISLLSGYLKKTREEGPTFFGICGDVLQEDVVGSDYKGTSTVELINYLRPDCLSLGNHELDYGLAHLLIFKECIRSPILCANLLVSKMNQMLFQPSMVREIGGVRILFIGVIPKSFFNKILSDEFCRSTLEYKESRDAIRDEIEAHREEHIDLVVLMSHYGIEGDRKLAEEMPEDLRVDLILGGHSHIDMDKAEVVNGIPIAQSSYGTSHIGRFDLTVGPQCGISAWTWQRVPLTEQTSAFDLGVDDLADRVTFHVKKRRVNSVLCEFEKGFEHKSRLYETELGDLVADAFAEVYPVDFVVIQSGSIRRAECGPVVTQKDLREAYPFDDRFVSVELTGKEIKESFRYLFTLKPDGSVMNGTFQYSKGFRLVVDGADCWRKGCTVESLTLNGKEFEDEKIYRVGMTEYFVSNMLRYFSMPLDEGRVKLLSLSAIYDLAGWCLKQPGKIPAPEAGRFILRNFTE